MRKGLTWEEAVKITIEVCRGLGRAHQENIVHRDIKPANILLSPDLSAVKVSDFGIAHLPDRQLTSTGGMHPGTLLYMAPESFRRLPGQPLTGRADLYALGVTLYQLVTGKEYLNFDEYWRRAEKDVRRKFRLDPDVEPTIEQQIEWQILAQKYWVDAVCTVMPPDPREHNSEIPADLAKVIMRSLAKDPDDRYPTAEEMIDDLREAQLGKAKEISTPVVSETGWQVNEIIARSMDAARHQQLSTALELIHHAISLAPHSVRAHAALANIQMVCGDFPGACQAWHKVLELDPTYPELYVKLGQCYNRMDQHDKAIEIQKQGLRKPENRRSAALFYGLANSYYLAGRLDEAVWALEQSLQIRPDNRLKILLERWKAEQSRSG